jgi:hypothetical protein
VVVSTGVELTIRLQSRALVRAPKQKKLRLGDTVYVLYNYTTMQVRSLWTEIEYHADDEIEEEPEPIRMHPDDEEPHVVALLSDPDSVVSL